jgi:hypothetical protein
VRDVQGPCQVAYAKGLDMVADLRLITTTVPRLSTAVVAAQAKEVLVDWGEHALGHDGAVRWL